MSVQTPSSPSKGVSSGSRPSSRAASRPVGWLADHQPQPSAGRESAEKENAPPQEHTTQPSRPVATNKRPRSLEDALNDAIPLSAHAYHKSSSKRKVAHPVLLVQSPSSPPSPPAVASTKPSTPPTKVTGKRGSSSQEAAGPSSPFKRARRIQEKDAEGDDSAGSKGAGTKSTLPVEPALPVQTPAPLDRRSLRRLGPTPLELVLDYDSPGAVPKTRQQHKAALKYPSPTDNGDVRALPSSGHLNARGGRDNCTAATMARRTAEVQELKARYESLVAQLHSEERMANPLADDTLEEDFAKAAVANQAWRDAERNLASASSPPSPEKHSLALPTLPAPDSVDTGYDTPSIMQRMQRPYTVLWRYLDNILPPLPSVSANGGDVEVEATDALEVRNKREGRARRAPPTNAAPSKGSRGEGVPPAPSAQPSLPAPVWAQNDEASGSGAIPASATLTGPSTGNAVASSSGANTANTPFRFNENDEALLLGYARDTEYREAFKMLPDGQKHLVLTSRAEIEAVRLIHPRPKIRPKNKGKGMDDENRKIRTHIGKDGVETELWVCRASFKIEKGCNSINYLESPCGYPVGTKDSWVRHMKDVHLGRVNRAA